MKYSPSSYLFVYGIHTQAMIMITKMENEGSFIGQPSYEMEHKGSLINQPLSSSLLHHSDIHFHCHTSISLLVKIKCYVYFNLLFLLFHGKGFLVKV